MSDFVLIDSNYYETTSVETNTEGISFTVASTDLNTTLETFKSVTSLQVTDERKQVYGVYDNVLFTSALVDAGNNVSVTYRVLADTELRLKKLEEKNKTLDEQMTAAEIALTEVYEMLG